MSENPGNISEKHLHNCPVQSIDNKILKRIQWSRRGSVFTQRNFLDLGSRTSVDKALSLLTQQGLLQRLARGVYHYPKIHPELGILAPDPLLVAKAIAGKSATRLQPSGAFAANLLGLSEQVPAKIVFLTDGPSRTVKIGQQEIQLRSTSPRNMATAGRLSGLLLQAFQHLGKENVTPSRLEHLKRTLPKSKRQLLINDLKFAPTWAHHLLRELAEY